MKPRIRLGEMLIRAGVIAQEQLDEALEEQKSSKAKIGEILVELGHTTEDKIFLHLARQLDIPYMSLKSQRIEQEVLKLVSSEMARKYNIIPIDKIGKLITIAMSDPLNDEACALVEKMTGLRVQKMVSTKGDIVEAIERYYPAPASESLPEDIQAEEQEEPEIEHEEKKGTLPQEELREQLEVESQKTEDGKIKTSISPFPPRSQVSALAGIQHFRKEDRTAIEDERFVTEYTFDNFVSDNNAEVLQAAMDICNKERVMYNPLLIYGETGLGKTHLLHAIGNEITQNSLQKNIEYVNCRELSLRVMDADIYEVCTELCEDWNSLDIMLFDDFQVFLAEKIHQEAFIFIFDFLYQRRKQMVIASNPLDDGTAEIEDSLLSRIKAGLTVEIKPPNLETRLTILRKWGKLEGDSELSDTDLNSIAERDYEDVRQLLAARNRLRFQV